jgi:DNA-binding IclR family transcriptional regulator
MQPPSLTDVAADAGLAVPTALRYLSVLERAGYVERDPLTLRYGLGMTAASLAASSAPGSGMRRAARYALQGSDGFQGILHLAVIRGPRLYHIERLEFGARVLERSCVGAAYDPLTSVAGRSLLAGLDEPRRDDIVAHSAAARLPQTIARLQGAAASVGEHGFHCDDLDASSGLMCLAMPVRSRASGETYAACVTVPAFGTGRPFPPRLVGHCAEIARRMSRALA